MFKTRIPALHQFLHARDVDAPVVQPVLDVGHVLGEKAAVSADGVTAQRNLVRLGAVLADEVERQPGGLVQCHGRGLDGLKEPRLGVHLNDDGFHVREHVLGLVNDKIGPLGHHVQLVIGDDGGNFDDGVNFWIETGHLEVHPNQHPDNLGRLSGREGIGVPSVRTMVAVHIKQLDESLPLPRTASRGDAGTDLHARNDAVIAPGGGRLLMPTGIAIALPEGYAGFVLPRSGLALNHGISVVNAPGLIDSGYRGELKVVLLNTDPTRPYRVSRGDRIAQLVVQKVEYVEWLVVDELGGHDRGGGFGHSGR